MKPTETLDLTERKPTVQEMIRVAYAAGVDRLAMVREAEGMRKVGVAVLVIGHQALRELGPGLLNFAEQTGRTKPLDRSQVLDLQYETSLKHLFEWLEVTGNGYAHGTFEIEETKQPVLFAAYLGAPICEPLARFLTRRGCVTNLE